MRTIHLLVAALTLCGVVVTAAYSSVAMPDSPGALKAATPAAVIDPTRLPLGDGKLSVTEPRIGYVFSCTIPRSNNSPGKAPWISADKLTWDSTAKATVSGAVLWVSEFSISLSNGIRSLSGNGLPNHDTGTFPIARSDPAHAFDANPNAIRAVAVAWGLPANPSIAAEPGCTGLGAIGILLNGVRLFNALDADGRDAVAHEVQDACGGHPQRIGAYHYHDLTKCLAQNDQPGSHSPLVGYIADGFGLYGNLGEGGKPLSNADLDACHGHTHELMVDGARVTQYHYHTTREYPYTIGCFAGKPARMR
ncbi:MAG: YHYH protein [Sphingomonadaceae bacterium]